MPPFLWCPRLMLSAPQYPFFPAGGSQREAPEWTSGVMASHCKTAVDCLPGNSSSRHRSNVMHNQRSRCRPMSSCAKCQIAILDRCGCPVATLTDLPGDSVLFGIDFTAERPLSVPLITIVSLPLEIG
ncbi:hypothetical protein TNCV_3939461 [Trichonephila clavipes]|uniref:Uncharacterized protein n=1 Tax=Trichonephila clavipes TaxID=2585209 RepID=A0A8X7B8A8_TRICX|nr:hypothetical protein TNCV_3939461 [Trichonephila clavipes]